MNIADLSLDGVGGGGSSGHKQSVNKHHKSAAGRRMEAWAALKRNARRNQKKNKLHFFPFLQVMQFVWIY